MNLVLSVDLFEDSISYFCLSIFAPRFLVRFDGKAGALIGTTSLRKSRMISDVLDSWDSGFVRFLIMEHQMLLSHYCDVVLPVKVLLVCVEVDQFRVQRLIEQLEVLQTFLEFPEPILSSACLFQHILDFVVA